jgi:hypothetical protein
LMSNLSLTRFPEQPEVLAIATLQPQAPPNALPA